MSSPQQPPPPEPSAQSQAAQAGLAILVAAAIAKLWPSLDLTDLRRSLPAFKAAVAQEVRRHAQASATLAARQYRSERVAAGVGGGFTPVPADPPSVAQVAQSVDWAAQPLWDSAVPAAHVPGVPPETQQAASSAIADAKARLAAASERLVLDTGQATITDNVHRDRKAKAYARVPEQGACFFCAMLASRGAVYKDGSFARSNAKFVASIDVPSTVKVHDHCRCHVEPVFNAYEPSAQIRRWQQLYKDTAAQIGYPGARVSAEDMQVAFRQALEGRPIDLERSRNMRADKAGKPRPSGSAKQQKPEARKPGERTQDQIRGELNAVLKHQAAHEHEWTEKQRTWINNRISILRKQLGE